MFYGFARFQFSVLKSHLQILCCKKGAYSRRLFPEPVFQRHVEKHKKAAKAKIRSWDPNTNLKTKIMILDVGNICWGCVLGGELF